MKMLVIGIAGGTGSGKSTVARNIVKELPNETIAIIDYDSYYKDRQDLSFEERCKLNYDHPESLDTQLLVDHIKRLKKGETVEIPIYDFKTHSRLKETRTVTPTHILVVEGILTFVEKALRDEFDMKIFVDTDADIRIFRRVRRDMEERGRSFQSIREQYYNAVRPMHLQFIEPSKRWADVIFPEGGENQVALDMIVGKLKHVLSSR
jgi:uridine kinase